MKQRVISLIWKEILAVLFDPKSRISIFFPPLVQLLIFAYAATLDVKNVDIAIFNRDSGKESFELIQRFKGSPVFNQISYLNKEEDIASYIDHQKGLMVMSFDEQFSRNLNAKKTANVQLILDGRKSNSAQILSGYASEIIQNYNAEVTQNVLQKEPKTKLVPRNWFNPNLLYIWYNIPCLVCTLAMLTCLVVTTNSVSREREIGTFDQLLVSPLTPREIVIGKLVPGILIGIVEGLFMAAMGVFVLGVPFTGSFFSFILSLFVFVTAISGVGIFISSLCNTQQQAMLGSFTFMLPSVLLSGFATPIENMPTWLQPVTYLIPLRYMLVISKGIFLKDISFPFILENVFPMGIIALCTLIGASIFFRKRLS
jgi:ABC-2 type transport system permease protein